MSQHRTIPSSNLSANTVNAVVEEIRSSLFLASSLVQDDAPMDSLALTGSRRNARTVHFECGRLKYSHVKGEWSILHRPIPSYDDKDDDNNHNSTTSKIAVAKVIASLSPASKRLNPKPEKKKTGRKRKGCFPEDYFVYDADENDVGSVINRDSEDRTMKAESIQPSASKLISGSLLEGMQTAPPLELVQCLLHGAEFISYLKCARRGVESSIQSSIHNENYGVHANANANVQSKKTKNKKSHYNGVSNIFNAKARFWSRRFSKNPKQRTINLQPLFNTIVGTKVSIPMNSSLLPMTKLKTDDDNIDGFSLSVGSFLLELIDECIRFAHSHTLDLTAAWSDSWQVRTNLCSNKLEGAHDEDDSFVSTRNASAPAKQRMKRRCVKMETMPSEAKTAMIDFVRACLPFVSEDISKSDVHTTDSTPKQYDTEISEEIDNNNGDRRLLLTKKRNTAIRRGKETALEPSDSLAANLAKRQKTATSKKAINHQSLRVSEDNPVEKRRNSRGKLNRHTPHLAISPALVNNYKTGFSSDLGRKVRIARNNTGSARKKTESLSQVIMNDPLITKEEMTRKGGINHDDGYDFCSKETKLDTLSGETKNSIDSLYEFFGYSEQPSGDDESTGLCIPAEHSDTRGARTHQPKQVSRHHVGRRSRTPRRSMRWNGVVTSPLIGTEQKICNENVSVNIASINQKGNDGIGSLQTSGRCDRVNNKIGVMEKTLSLSVEKLSCDDAVAGEKNSWTERTKGSLKLSPSVGESEVDSVVREVDYLAQNTRSSDQTSQSEHKLGDDANIKTNSATTSLKDTSNLPWVRLSFVGHISDYHGYKRRYEHFAPLQFGSIDDIRKQIGRTLVEKMEGNGEESDDEIIQENKDYEKAVKQYEVLAERERSLQLKVKNHGHKSRRKKSKTGSEESISVTFSSRTHDTVLSSPTNDYVTNKGGGLFEFDELGLQPTAKVRYFDEEDGALFDFDQGKNGENQKRRSRSAQITAQKKTSIRILSEMLHTLNFIEKYNHKSKVESCTENEKGKDLSYTKGTRDTRIDLSRDFNQKCLQKLATRKSKKAACYDTKIYGKVDSPATLKPPFAPMTPTLHLENYRALQKMYPSFHPLQVNGNIENVKEDIQSILRNDNLLREFLEAKEFVSEEKHLARCIRSYSRKADQEKIEKKNFEEEQKLKKHEFDYYQQRRKKRSPQDVEWKEIFTRPIRHVGRGVSLPQQIETCKFKPYCFICDPYLRKRCCDDMIHFPGFRQVEQDICIPFELGPKNEERGRSKAHFVNQHKLASALKLMELYHTLEFIQDYNKGMIVSRKKRR